MNIRHAGPKDLGKIRKLIAEYPDVLLQEHLPRAKEFFVAVQKEKIIGCAALVIYSKRLAEVRSLAVSKDAQGKGIATKLIKACLKEAKKQGVKEVLAITGALSLFEKHGFGALRKEKYALLKPL